MTGVVASVVLAGVLVAPVALPQDADVDRTHPNAFVKDSVITTKIKSKLAADHVTSVGRIHVDTDADGVVWLSGTARSQDAIDRAVAVARDTEGVRDVRSKLKVRQDD
jgi:hyperosmotically inducible protein